MRKNASKEVNILYNGRRNVPRTGQKLYAELFSFFGQGLKEVIEKQNRVLFFFFNVSVLSVLTTRLLIRVYFLSYILLQIIVLLPSFLTVIYYYR